MHLFGTRKKQPQANAAQDAREQRHKEDKLNLEAATESSMGQAEENLSYSGKTRQPCGAARRSRMAPMTASARKNSIRQRSHAGRRVAGLCVGAR